MEAGDVASNVPNIVLRSMDDGGWYIPDKTTLESAFHGKVDLLNLPVQSVRSLVSVFEKLGCTDILLSSAVYEKKDPHGSITRDLLREEDLKARLRFIAW